MRHHLRLLLFLLLPGLQNKAISQDNGVRNNYVSEVGLPRLKIERSMIFQPDGSWMYSHHPSITHFKNKFIAIWSNGMTDEDASGQRVVFATSSDFIKWSAPKELADPSVFNNDTLNVLTAAGFHQYKDTLGAYFGEYSPHRTNTHLWAKVSTDGENWSNRIDMKVPVNSNHGPQVIAGGRLIISGNFTFPYTDDPAGLRGWTMSSFYADSIYKEDNPATFYSPAAKNNLPPLCEGFFFQTDDGVLHSMLRVTGKGWKGRLWLTESKDRGVNWSFPTEASFSDNDSKFHFGQLPDKRFYYVGIPDTTNHYVRTPLIISVSKDGHFFNRHFIIADEAYTLKKEGLWKGGQYGYPHTIIDRKYMYVIISRQKEAVEVIRFKLDQLK
jgi:hypothetical protein